MEQIGTVAETRFECPFERFGCTQRLQGMELSGHIEMCHFNVCKFGELVSVCHFIGYQGCNFKINGGNANQALQHFRCDHGCNVSKSSEFLLQFHGVSRSDLLDNRVVFFTKTIFESQKNKVFVMLVPVKKGESLGMFAVVFPIGSGEEPDISRYNFTYSIKSEPREGLEPVQILGVASTIFYKNVVDLKLDPFPIHQNIQYLKDFAKNPESGEIRMVAKLKYGRKVKPGNTLKIFSCVPQLLMKSCVVDIGEDKFKLHLFRKLTTDFQKNDPELYTHTYKLSKRVYEDNVEMLNFLDFTAIAQSCNVGSIEALKAVLDLGADPNVASEKGETPLQLALLNKNREDGIRKLLVLLENNAFARSFTRIKSNSLHYAVASNNVKAVEKLIEEGCNVNIVNAYGFSPMGFCIHLMPYLNQNEDSLEVAYLLLFAGAKKVLYSLVSKTFNLDRYTELHPELKGPVGNDFTFRV